MSVAPTSETAASSLPPATADGDAATPALPRRLSQIRLALSFLAKCVALGVAVFATLVAFVYFVPDGSDYMLATRTKHAWLEAEPSRNKIVFVGGSNLAYGLDSERVEQATGLRVANMGMNGYVGVRFMLNEIKSALRPGDVVVMAFEYDSFVKSVDGEGPDLMGFVKGRPVSFWAMTWKQRWLAISAVPQAAQYKLIRLARDAGRAARGKVEVIDPRVDFALIERASAFNQRGDLTSHFGITWPREREQGFDLTKLGLDPSVAPLLAEYAQQMQASGVTVYLSYGPLLREFYEEHQKAVQSFHQAMLAATPLRVLGVPTDFVYDDSLFFDTVYHLTEEGRALRSTKLGEQLAPLVQR